MDKKEIAPLFDGWDKTMIWSYLQGYMGYAMTDENNPPKSAQIIEGDFCFFAGKPKCRIGYEDCSAYFGASN